MIFQNFIFFVLVLYYYTVTQQNNNNNNIYGFVVSLNIKLLRKTILLATNVYLIVVRVHLVQWKDFSTVYFPPPPG